MAGVLTASEYAETMVAQLRLLIPSISAEVDTPERLILDTVAGALAESSIDLVGLQSALNIESKFGSNLTSFLSIFGFNRQQASTATGYVVFSRKTPSPFAIQIPSGMILKSSVPTTTDGTVQEFVTTSSVTVPQEALESPPCPIRSTTPGAPGNVPANSITILASPALGPALGIESVTNPAPTTGGSEEEDDNSFKARFKNTVFRNLSGTEDQFLALAIAGAFSTKAIAIGPISKYQEYIEVPEKEDGAEYKYSERPVEYYGVPFTVNTEAISNSGTKVTVKSTTGMVPGMNVFIYANENYPELLTPSTTIVSISGSVVELSKAPIDPVNEGLFLAGKLAELQTGVRNQWTTALSENPFSKEVWPGFSIFVSNANSELNQSNYFYREGVDFNFNYPAKFQGDTVRSFIAVDPHENETARPNVTFTNVYVPSAEPVPGIKAIQASDILLLEYDYVSSASRNSIAHGITNAVDVYVDGKNSQSTSTLFTAPLTNQEFVDNPTSLYYYENFRRDGEPTRRPLLNNILTVLFSRPIVSIPNQINIGPNKYYLGTHYWLVHDVSYAYGGTIRARDGIEWNSTIGADRGGEKEGIPTLENPEPEYTGEKFGSLHSPTTVEVENYFYNQNIETLQAELESNRQITTDVLAHEARLRFLKLDITVVYSPLSNPGSTNNAIREAISTFFNNQYFGGVIRLSDLLQVIHNVTGIENVRWTNDVPGPKTSNIYCVYETDNEGLPLRGVFFDRIEWGSVTGKEIQTMYVVGQPTSGEFSITYKNTESIKDVATVTAAELTTAIEASTGKRVTVQEEDRSEANEPIKSFRITFEELGKQNLPTVEYSSTAPFERGEYVYDGDFFLRDDELPILPEGKQPGDTVPGLIIRARAQNVWQKGA